tara:strand:- start:659 stop:970 length:312 start_codon:yes stop_codon:yes gene_type:complete
MSKKNQNITVTVFDINEHLFMLQNACVSERERVTDITYRSEKGKSNMMFVHKSEILNFATEEDEQLENMGSDYINLKRTYINTDVEGGEWEGFKLESEIKTFI